LPFSGTLARDERVAKEQKTGDILMVDAMTRARAVSSDIGCAGLMLDARNEGLVRYYQERFGFEMVAKAQLPGKMVLMMTDLKAALDASAVRDA
jgi:hypothetical protein